MTEKLMVCPKCGSEDINIEKRYRFGYGLYEKTLCLHEKTLCLQCGYRKLEKIEETENKEQ